MLTRRNTARSQLPWPIRDMLLTGNLRSDEEQARLVAGGQPYNRLLFWTTSTAQLLQHWTEHRPALLAGWIQERPGTRPEAWWWFEASEPRRRKGGVGDALGAQTRRGIPQWWMTAALVPYVNRVPVSAADPPRFESEAAYLDRVGRLSPDERQALSASDFQDETVHIDRSSEC